MISSVFAEECAYALMAEVGATPKPGLVDRHDSGAHTDMDYDTFAASTTAIVPYLARMFEAGYTWESKDFMHCSKASVPSVLRRKRPCLLPQMV